LALDVHPRVQHGLLWIWVDFEGQFHSLIEGKPNLYEVAEVFDFGTIPDLKEFIDLTEIMIGRKHDLSLCEPAAWNTNQTEIQDKPIVEQLNAVGIYPLKGSKDMSGGILKVAEVLTMKENQDHPRLMCFERLSRTRWERNNWHWPEDRMKWKVEKAVKEKPIDRDDHMMESERRIIEYVFDENYELIEEKRQVPQYKAPDGRIIEVDFSESEYEEEVEGIKNAILGM